MRLPGPDSSCFRASPLVGIVEPIRAAALALCGAATGECRRGEGERVAEARRARWRLGCWRLGAGDWGAGDWGAGDWGAGDWVVVPSASSRGVIAGAWRRGGMYCWGELAY